MITKAERDRGKAIAEEATRGPWRWWTSNSHRRLRSDAPEVRGDVAWGTKQHDGYDDIVISDADMAAIENAVNRLPAYLAEAEAIEQRIEKIEQRRLDALKMAADHRAGGMHEAALEQERRAAQYSEVLWILAGA